MSAARVGVNLLWLVAGSVGGSEQATVGLLQGIRVLDPPDLEVHLFVLSGFAEAHPEVVDAFPTEVLRSRGGSRSLRVTAEATWLARRTRTLDLVHHAGGTIPVRGSRPCVLTLHDIQPLERRATHSRLKRAYLGAAIPHAIRTARRTAVPSEFVRSTVLARLDIAPDRIEVVPHAVEGPETVTPPAAVRARYGIDGRIVLYPAITYPHKNHATLVAAFATVVQDHPDAVLVLTGGEGAAEGAVRSQIDGLGLGPRVRRLGRIPDADIAGLFEAAEVVAVPSLYEGFGLPALEAMVAGVPLVAAMATALPEVVADAGVLVPPTSVEAWSAAISGLLRDPDERARLGVAGRARAARFTPRATAEGILELYRSALADG